MPTFIALLRGINVGGAGTLPMKELVTILESLGCERVRTYIQSGNAVFSSRERSTARLAGSLSAEILKCRGFAPSVMLLTVKEFEQAMRDNPFSDATDPSRLGVCFLEAVPKNPDTAALETLRAKNERFSLVGKCFYLDVPDGFSRSKLAARAGKFIGVQMTMRNWRTVGKIWELAAKEE